MVYKHKQAVIERYKLCRSFKVYHWTMLVVTCSGRSVVANPGSGKVESQFQIEHIKKQINLQGI